MLRTDFELKLKSHVLIISGSIGAELERRQGGAGAYPFTPSFILEEPEMIRSIHRDYAEAGADILVTGTGRANRVVLATKNLTASLEEINRLSVEHCKASVGPHGLVFGALGPTGALLKPYGRLSEEDYCEIFQEQATHLLDAGVDGFILQGFSSLIEAEQCVLGLNEACSVPIIATMTVLEDGTTKFGDSIEDCFQTLNRAGADVVGLHGTLGPLEIEGFLAHLKKHYPLCVRPNAGYPVRIGNRQTYLSSPEYVAECAEMFLERGAVIVGGAAGFTPAHIGEVARRLRGRQPVLPEPPKKKTTVVSTAQTEESPNPVEEPLPNLEHKLGKEPILTVELEPPHGLGVEPIINLLTRLKPYGIDAINIPENPLARARVSSIALAKVIRERTGLHSIAHVTCRDRNLISLQAELLGAHMLGVNTILALTGDPTSVGDFPGATSNFDVDSLGLVEIMARMNIGKDFGMNDLGDTTSFNIGVAANPLSKNLDSEMRRLETKLKRGATFIQTQPIFDPSLVEPFLKAIEPYRVPVIFGVMLIRDYRNARFLINEYPGIHIRDEHLERFRNTDEDLQEKLGVSLACEMVRELSAMSGGVYLMPSFGDEERLVDLFKHLNS